MRRIPALTRFLQPQQHRRLIRNAAPTITVPGAQSVYYSNALTFTGISIADTDGNNQTVTLTVSHGTLTLSGTTGLSFSVGDGTADATMTFSGTIAAINTALNGMTYRATGSYTGSETLAVGTDDGAGGTDSDTVAITVNWDPGILAPFAWFDLNYGTYSDAGTTPAVLDDPVYQWNDKSGNGKHISQSTLANRPLLKSDGVLFDGSNDWMERLSTTLAQPMTFLIIGSWTTVDGCAIMSGGGGRMVVIQNGGSPLNNLVLYSGVNLDCGVKPVANTVNNIIAVGNGASSSLEINGTSVSGDAGAAGITSIQIGRESPTAHVRIKEIVILSAAASAGNITSWKAYTAARWGV